MSNPFNAGLPNAFSEGNTNPGDIKFFGPGSPLLFTDQDGEWLRSGSFINYSPAYAGLAKNHPGWLCRDMPTPFAMNLSTAFSGKMFYVGGKYSLIAGGSSSGHINHRYGSDLSLSDSHLTSSLSAVLSSCYCAGKLGNTVVVGGYPIGTNAGIAAQTSNGSFFGAFSGFPASSILVQRIATNGVDLGVAAVQGAQSAGVIYTTSTGTSWTARTGALGSGGSAGASGPINAMYWSTSATAFLFVVGTNALNKSVDGFTQSLCSLPPGVTFMPDQWDYYCASSPSSTLIVLADGRLLRTADGNTASVIDPALYGCLQPSSASRIVFDGSRYVIYNYGGASAAPSFIYSDDDGMTWKNSAAFEELTVLSTNSWSTVFLSVVNNKTVVAGCLGNPSGGVSRLYDLSDQIAAAPVRVGSHRPITFGAGLLLPGYVLLRNR